jgi:NADH:ubiquinone oxidoreductase subunit 4 (subunit M)
LVSLFAVHELYAFIFCVAQVLGAVYAFWAFNRIIHGQSNGIFMSRSLASLVQSGAKYGTVDLTRFEFFMLLPLMVGVFWLGLKPMA